MNRGILVVDDMQEVRNYVTKVLSKENFQMMEASTGEEAMEKLQQSSKIGLVFVDINLPDMDGFRLMEMIREIPRYDDVKTCFLSSKKDRENIERAVALGADDYIVKPLYKDVLSKKVYSLLRGRYSPEFAALNVNFKAQLLESDVVPDLFISEFSEEGLQLRSTAKIASGKVIKIVSRSFSNISEEIPEVVVCRITECNKVRHGLHFLRAEYVGMNEAALTSIRAAAVRGRLLNYESSAPDDEI